MYLTAEIMKKFLWKIKYQRGLFDRAKATKRKRLAGAKMIHIILDAIYNNELMFAIQAR
jgi:hypothetical protein